MNNAFKLKDANSFENNNDELVFVFSSGFEIVLMEAAAF